MSDQILIGLVSSAITLVAVFGLFGVVGWILVRKSKF